MPSPTRKRKNRNNSNNMSVNSANMSVNSAKIRSSNSRNKRNSRITYSKFEDFFLDRVNKLKTNYNSLPNGGKTLFKNDIVDMFNQLDVGDKIDFEVNYNIHINKIDFLTKKGLDKVIDAIKMHQLNELLESINI